MLKQFHGKYYYIECPTIELACKVMSIINTISEFDGVKFRVVYNTVIVSEAKVGTFRGIRYEMWEKVKRDAYKLFLQHKPI